MNFPPAPLSMSPRVLMVGYPQVLYFYWSNWQPNWLLIEIWMDNKFNLIVAKFTEKISNTGEINIDAALHFKSPLFLLLGRILLSLFSLSNIARSLPSPCDSCWNLVLCQIAILETINSSRIETGMVSEIDKNGIRRNGIKSIKYVVLQY